MEKKADLSKQFMTPPFSFYEERNDKDGLTPREMESLFYLSRGLTMKEIARYMGISPRTIENYLEKIKLRIGVTLRSELVKYYFISIEHLYE